MNGTQEITSGDGAIRTRDLPLAAFLKLHDVTHMSMELQGRIAWWVFPRNDKTRSLLREYRQGEVMVNLPRYMDCVADVRNDLYSFLDAA